MNKSKKPEARSQQLAAPVIERRFIKGGKIQVRAKSADAKPGIEGYAAVFSEQYDNGWFFETIMPGAFSRALKEKQDVRCLFNHDANNLLGRTKSSTLALDVDDEGLKFSCDLNSETRIGNEVFSMIQRGDLDGCSFAFIVTKQTWREEKEGNDYVTYREIEDVDLFDVGPVTYPAYPQTSVGVRALWPDGVPAEIRSHVAKLRDDGSAPAAPGSSSEQRNEECQCECPECMDGDCANCSDPDCEDPNCEGNDDRSWRDRAEMRLRMARTS